MSAADERQALLEKLRAASSMKTEDAVRHVSCYSAKINKYISSVKEVRYYMSLKLKEIFVHRPTLAQKIDTTLVDSTGQTNADRMRHGLPPVKKNGEDDGMELHHIKQDFYAPFAELTAQQHISANITKVLHPYGKDHESWRKSKKKVSEYGAQREAHWEKRLEDLNVRRR